MIKYVFRFFEPFRARLTSKFAKNANMTHQIVFSNYFYMGIIETLKPNAHKTAQKTKNIFFKRESEYSVLYFPILVSDQQIVKIVSP